MIQRHEFSIEHTNVREHMAVACISSAGRRGSCDLSVRIEPRIPRSEIWYCMTFERYIEEFLSDAAGEAVALGTASTSIARK